MPSWTAHAYCASGNLPVTCLIRRIGTSSGIYITAPGAFPVLWKTCISGRCCDAQALDAELAEPGRAALCSNQALANSLWSYATLRYYPLQFLPQFCREVGRPQPHRHIANLNLQRPRSPLLSP